MISHLRLLAAAAAAAFLLATGWGTGVGSAQTPCADLGGTVNPQGSATTYHFDYGTTGTYGLQLFSLRREQGRLAELAPVVRVLAGSGRDQGPWRPGMVAVLAELGMRDEARSQLQRKLRPLPLPPCSAITIGQARSRV